MRDNSAEIRRLLWRLIKSNMPVFNSGQCYDAIVRAVDSESLVCSVSTLEDPEVIIDVRLTSIVRNMPSSSGEVLQIDPEGLMPEIDTPESHMVIIPSIGSSVLVQAIKDDPDNLVVAKISQFSEVRYLINKDVTFISDMDGHRFNSGQLGGMVITPKLVQELEKVNDYLSSLKTSTKAIAKALDGLVPGTSATFDASMLEKELGDYSEIENPKVKH